jgi:hypothetical protein
LAKKIKQLLTKVETIPIQMPWTEDYQHGEYSSAQNGIIDLTSGNNYVMSAESIMSQGEKMVKCKKSLRIRKAPITKSNDFLW